MWLSYEIILRNIKNIKIEKEALKKKHTDTEEGR